MKIKEYMKSINNELMIDKSIIQEYEEVLKEKKQRFSYGIWHHSDADQYARNVLRYLFEEKLDYSFDEIKQLTTYTFKTTWKINGLIKYVYGGSFQEAILDVYGDYINAWDFNHSAKYLAHDDRIEMWLTDFAETHLEFESKEELLDFFSTPHLKKYHGKLFNYFEGSPYKIYKYFFPYGEIRPYEFKMGHNHLWEEKEMVNEFLLYLLNEEGMTTSEKYVEKVSTNDFRVKMRGLYKKFGSSPWNLYQYLKMEDLVSFEVAVFDLNVMPNGFYHSDANKIAALHWLIYAKLNIQSKEEYIQHMSTKTLDTYLRGLAFYFPTFAHLHAFIVGSQLIEWNIHPWEYKSRPVTLWTDEDIRVQAIQWFFETYLAMGPEEVHVDSFKVNDIWDARLKELYQPYFSKVYPNPKEVWVNTYQKSRHLN